MNKLQRVSGILVAVSLFVPVLAAAQTTGSSTVDTEIQSLLSQISSLQQQLKSLVQSVAPSSTPLTWNASSTPSMMGGDSGSRPETGMGGCGFDRDLSVGSQGSDVMQLQQMLSGDGFLSASSTGFFGPLTARALASFQSHFGIAASSSATGFFGPLTRNFLSAHCGQRAGQSTMQGTTSGPMIPAGQHGSWMGTSTSDHVMFGPMSSTSVPGPCANNENQGAAAGLFVPHVILPMMMRPCGGSNAGQQGGDQ